MGGGKERKCEHDQETVGTKRDATQTEEDDGQIDARKKSEDIPYVSHGRDAKKDAVHAIVGMRIRRMAPKTSTHG